MAWRHRPPGWTKVSPPIVLSLGEILQEMSHWHLELVLQFHFGLVSQYLHRAIHWCSHLLLLLAEFVTVIIRMLCVSTQFAPLFGWPRPQSCCYSPEHVCPPGLRPPSSPSARLKSHLSWSIRFFSTWHRQPLLRCPSCRFSYCCTSAILRSKQQAVSPSIKVKVTLVQALKLCTGRTAHRGSRGIALLFHDQRH